MSQRRTIEPRYIPLEDREPYGHRERRPVQRLSRASDVAARPVEPQRRFQQPVVAAHGMARPVAPLHTTVPAARSISSSVPTVKARSGGIGRGLMAIGCGMFCMSVLYLIAITWVAIST